MLIKRTRKKQKINFGIYFSSATSTLICHLIFAIFMSTVYSISIDNSLADEPSVSCGADSVSLDIRTQKPFRGRIFVKGYSQDRNCQLMGEGIDSIIGFSINFDQCGLRRNREINGVSITTTIVISFHTIFITKVDRAYRLNCFYTEARKYVSQQLDVSMLTTRIVYKQTQMPVCRYDILSEGPQGSPMKYARIGDLVYHKWSCLADIPNLYCMKVHSCTVNDGQGGNAVFVLDQLGCEVDGSLIQNLQYTDDLVAGQSAYVYKFADKPTLHFNCQIELTLKDQQIGCVNSQPICESSSNNSYIDEDMEANSSQQTTLLSTSIPTIGASNSGSISTDQYPTPVPFDEAAYIATNTLNSVYKQENLPKVQYFLNEKNRLNSKISQKYQQQQQTTLSTTTNPATQTTINYDDTSVQTQVNPSIRDMENSLPPYEEIDIITSSTTTTTTTITTKSPSIPNPSALMADEIVKPLKKNKFIPNLYNADVDPIYQDEMDSFAMNRPTSTIYRFSNGTEMKNRKKSVHKRDVEKVANFDLPEQSLVVIEIDENPLALFITVLIITFIFFFLFIGFFLFVLRAQRRRLSQKFGISDKNLF